MAKATLPWLMMAEGRMLNSRVDYRLCSTVPQCTWELLVHPAAGAGDPRRQPM
jgi:hypothetical protein